MGEHGGCAAGASKEARNGQRLFLFEKKNPPPQPPKMLLFTTSKSSRKVSSPGICVLHAWVVQWGPGNCPSFKKQFSFRFFSPPKRRWGVQVAGNDPSVSAWWSRPVCVGSTSVRAVCLRHGFRRQSLKPVPDIRGPLPERPAVGCVTSAWGWSGLPLVAGRQFSGVGYILAGR